MSTTAWSAPLKWVKALPQEKMARAADVSAARARFFGKEGAPVEKENEIQVLTEKALCGMPHKNLKYKCDDGNVP